MNLGGLAGLSATYPGFQHAVTADLENQKNQAAATEAQNKLLAQAALGRAFGGMPGSQPMAPPPGQASVPRQPMTSPGAQPPPSPSPGAAPAGAPAPVGPMTGEVDLKTLTQRIIQTNPGIAGHPAVLMAALERAAPILDRQSREDLAEMRKEMSTARLTQAGELAKARMEAQKAIHDQVSADKAAAEAAKQTRFDNREGRLATQAQIRQDQGYQRLDLQRQDLERKIQETGDKQAMAAWRIVVNEQANRARAVINANSKISDLSEKDKATLIEQVNAEHAQVIEAMRAKVGSTTPTGGVTPPGQPVAPKIQGQVPQQAAPVPPPGTPAPPTPAPASPAGAPPQQPVTPPPAAMLKPGGINVINGVGWRLVNGQAVQVPLPQGQ